MMFRTHLVFAFLIGLVFLGSNTGNKYLFLSLVLLSGLIADIDYPKSKIGRKFFFVSMPLNFFFGHRRFFHSLFFSIIASVVIFLFFGSHWRAILIGYSSHIFLDMMTKKGVMLFYPFDFRVRGIIETGGLVEELLFFVIIFLSLVKFISL